MRPATHIGGSHLRPGGHDAGGLGHGADDHRPGQRRGHHEGLRRPQKGHRDNADKIAKAEKIGPPAGHIAVSAQWIAGSAAVIAHSIGANDAVSAAADTVQQEMMNLGDAYNKSANAKPSKTKLEAAIKELTAACSAT